MASRFSGATIECIQPNDLNSCSCAQTSNTVDRDHASSSERLHPKIEYKKPHFQYKFVPLLRLQRRELQRVSQCQRRSPLATRAPGKLPHRDDSMAAGVLKLQPENALAVLGPLFRGP
eukprot:1608972-Rhodomonas_salina.8